VPITSSMRGVAAARRMGGLAVAALVLVGCAQGQSSTATTTEFTEPPTADDKIEQQVVKELDGKLGEANYEVLLTMSEGDSAASLHREVENNEAHEILTTYHLEGDKLAGAKRYRSTQKLGSGPMTATYESTGTPDPGNRQLVTSMYHDVIDLRKPDAPARYLAEDYIQHNPAVEQGRAGIEKFIASAGPAPAGASTRTEALVIADGELVLMVSDLGGGKQIADLFRVQEGQVAEHWDFVPAS
jgi:predicted SnoaL-like aldol condensation-catalyzing enzyme